MDALIARADAIRPFSELKSAEKGKGKAKASGSKHKEGSSNCETSSFHQDTLNKDIAKTTLETQQNLLALAADDAGGIQVDGPLEKTWRISQVEIQSSVGGEAAKGRRDLTFRAGEGARRMRWTRNGRHLVFISGKGGTKVSSVDWMGGQVNSEVDLLAGSNFSGAGGNGGGGEAARDVTFLQDQSFFAVAQKRNVFVYDRDGVEVHRLKNIVDPLRLEFLPWHWLLVATLALTIVQTNTGHISWTDTTTGTQIAVHRTKLGACQTLTQNMHNAVVHLGHNNGNVTLWTPNLSKPAVQILAHLGAVTSISVNPSDNGAAGSVNMPGRYMATSGRDGKVKIWDCRNWKGVVREWNVRGAGDVELEWSQKGYLGVLNGGSVNVYHPPHIVTPYTPPGGSTSSPAPPLYLTHAIPHRPLTSLRFEPFSDPQFDSYEADPFENPKARREREVKGLLDKIQPDMIALDPVVRRSLVTTAAQSLLDKSDQVKWGNNVQVKASRRRIVPFARMKRVERLAVQGKLDTTGMEDGDSDNEDVEMRDVDDDWAEKEKRKMRGKNKSLKRYLRKQRKNVVDPQVLAVRAKVERMKAGGRKPRKSRRRVGVRRSRKRRSRVG
ncbi:hypothetical protein FA13DRAFT_1766474 [Coprinellus micaceus]|uniref:BING4 C-terminal domain-containing protein n=1 Tax=Coprinellus micaceus TaxID=71717 RepID=A0A4Y7SLB0_COPMI|nr:hypothetical protein FA13DRAFT_1766474 [Coprinellus micaceus]